LAERISPIKKRLKIETPIIDETAASAAILSNLALEFPEFLGRVPVVARGKAYGELAGVWYRVPFPKTLNEPSVVAVAEGRAGAIPSIAAPKISIATVEITTTSVAVPAAIPVEIPVTVIPYLNESFPYLTSDLAWVREQICAPINKIVASLYRVQSRINDTIGRINEGFGKTKKAVEDTNKSISDLRVKSESAINTGLSGSRDKTQRALNTSIVNTQDSVNKGLGALIPALYAAWGLPSTMIITPIHIRNVTSTGFEFQSYGKTTCYYIAVGSRF